MATLPAVSVLPPLCLVPLAPVGPSPTKTIVASYVGHEALDSTFAWEGTCTLGIPQSGGSSGSSAGYPSLSAGGLYAADPYLASVTLLMGFDGVVPFIDESPCLRDVAPSAQGASVVGAIPAIVSGAIASPGAVIPSGVLLGNDACLITNGATGFGSGDFSIEGWAMPLSSGDAPFLGGCILKTIPPGPSGVGLLVQLTAIGVLEVYGVAYTLGTASTPTLICASSYALPMNMLTDFSVVRSSGVLALGVGGSSTVGVSCLAYFPSGSDEVLGGANYIGANPLNQSAMVLDEIRISTTARAIAYRPMAAFPRS